MASQSSVNTEAVLGNFFQRVKYSAKHKNVAKKIKSFTPSQEILSSQFVPSLSAGAGIRTTYPVLRPINSPGSVRHKLKPVQQQSYNSNSFGTPQQTRSKVTLSEPEIIKIRPVNKIKMNEVRITSRPLATDSASLNNLNQYQARISSTTLTSDIVSLTATLLSL